MGKITVTDEAGAPATPDDGVTLFSIGAALHYIDESGTVHEIVTDNNPALAAAAAAAAALAGGATVTDARLKEWVSGEDYEITAATYDSDGVVTTATVKWPDGSAGTFTTTTKNSTWLAVDAYTISHTASGKTVTQAAVTRNGNGQVTVKPSLTVA